MKIAIALLGSLATFAQQHSNSLEDPQLRARAIGLPENADRLSSPIWPMNEEVFSFHIPNPVPGEELMDTSRSA